ncbi:MAG TPA: nuclear transport factor 2 family protein [Thermoanaerobaculia bacterium]|nr:nuclear transport factor 2 family protein [Thermoanaerobaculia bacterium]
MKTRVLTGMLVVLAALALAPAARAQDGPQGLDAAWVKAMKAGDANAVTACYASDAVLWMPGDREAKGTRAIHDLYAGLLGTYTVKDASLTDTQYETMQNVGMAWGHFTLALQPKAGGAPTIMGGRFSSVARKVDGKWRYVVDHASVEPPPPPPAPAK